jgi:hypothetical protein
VLHRVPHVRAIDQQTKASAVNAVNHAKTKDHSQQAIWNCAYTPAACLAAVQPRLNAIRPLSGHLVGLLNQ